ncbi:DNA polymerase, putative [Entamoeba histolytica HM-1:IMSS]|uniref:DNA-directed DNA polymerase n=1 Tax=Entamoeba histolytica (strain ATCC 30459 / HM-1:IMSS / ABRM) TaxID=294381 RepID=B1N3D4_ENTH1|nr:DNA polymerase, putative [Entamoeba histolytica HM-1:IMSS]EDS89522.1 DNA polymerase, putative [Entamoeba histolytica HM-1:IMSS]|eukprot:XP_001913700.1 DNA polymerase, putative [Entamoeba histolytica HM-1:IMSS]
MSYRQNKNNIFNIKRKEQERRRQRRRQQLLNDHRAIEDGITVDDHRRRPQRRRVTMRKKDYEKMEKTTTVFSNPSDLDGYAELEKTVTNSHSNAFFENHREVEKKATISHGSAGFETIGDRVRNRREAVTKSREPEWQASLGEIQAPPYEAIDSLAKEKASGTIGEYGAGAISARLSGDRSVSGASPTTPSFSPDPLNDPSQDAPMNPPEETPFVPTNVPPNDAQMMEDALTDGEVAALLEEINHEEENATLDFLTLDRVPPTENEIHLLQLARANNTDDEIEFSVIKKRDFGLENTAQAWRGMLGETYRISRLIKEHDLIPLVELVFGGRRRRFIVNLENIEPQVFINKCVGFEVGIEEFWRRYDDEESELNIPPGKIVNEIIITIVKPPQRQRIDGAVFNYYLDEHWQPLEYILKKYQIYVLDEVATIENCFVNALHQSGVLTSSEMTHLRSIIKGISVTKKTLRQVAEEFKLNITLRYYKGDKIESSQITYGNRSVKLFLLRWKKNNHYIIDDTVPVTSYFITHYDEIVEYAKENNEDITKYFNVVKKERGQYKHSLSRFIPAYKCIKLLQESNAFKETRRDCLIKTKYYDSFLFDSINDELTKIESRIMGEIKKKEVTNTLLFADFECFTSGEFHQPFCIIVMKENGAWKSFYGLHCAYDFIEYISTIDSPICYFHNLGYDGRFLARFGIINIIMRGKMIYKMVVEYKGKKIIFKDTLSLIPTSIANFKQFFKLDGEYEKEILPYNYYSEETMEIGIINECGNNEQPVWSEDTRKKFKDLLVKCNCLIDDTHFNSKKYCEYYCLRDVLVLREGFLKYRQMVQTHLQLDCVCYASLSSMAYAFFVNNCFAKDALFEYTGVVREYIKQAVYGGRNMTSENKKYYITDEIVDFDACSLYPSAIARLYLPLSSPNRMVQPIEWYLEHLMDEQQFEPTETKFISYFVVTIEITKINKKRKMPIIIKKVNGINQYINEETTMTVDSIYLEDLIKYQEIEFKVVQGIYWKGTKVGLFKEKIKEIYRVRKEMKQSHDPAEIIFKLVMNSSYGKTIQKPIKEEKKFFRGRKKMTSFWRRHLEDVIVGEQLHDADVWMVNVKKQIDDFYIPNIIGVLILSMSKRIMNELIYLCEDLDIDVYYQDTDSIHIKKKDLLRLEKEFKEKYGRDLVGSELGQFHSDFPPVKGKPSWSIKSIFLGKKSYLDVLTNEDGDIDYLIRMKGIPKKVILGTAKEKFEGDVVALYEHLYAGYPLSFDLSKYGPHFVIERDFRVRTLDEFKRTIKF